MLGHDAPYNCLAARLPQCSCIATVQLQHQVPSAQGLSNNVVH